jgi:AcrR family transcriptional regulator
MVEATAECGFAGVTVKLVTVRAGVSSRTFYEHFESLRDCFLAVLDLGLECALGLIEEPFERGDCWQDGTLGVLAATLGFLDSEPLLARVWFVETMAAGTWALQRRERNAVVLRERIIERWSAAGAVLPDPIVVAGVMASASGLVQAHLLSEEPGPLTELLGPLMGLVTAPYLDRSELEREATRAARLADSMHGCVSVRAPARVRGLARRAGGAPAARSEYPSAPRARECLLFLAEYPGSSNRELALGVGIAHQPQISRLLASLLGEGLVGKSSAGAGKRNAWHLTRRGKVVVGELTDDGLFYGASDDLASASDS